MMGSLAKQYGDQLKKNYNCHGVWLPIVSSVSVGDYGTYSDGVFTRLGNLADHAGIAVSPVDSGEAIKDIVFQTDGVKSSQFVMDGSAKTTVQVVPDSANVEAGISYSFTKSNSFSVSCTDLSLQVISGNPTDYFHDTVWPALTSQGRKWDSSMRIVYQAYLASNYIMMASSKSNTNFTLSGSGSAVFDVGEGRISSKLSLSNDNSAELSLTGYDEPGVVGISLMSFKGDGTPVIPSD